MPGILLLVIALFGLVVPNGLFIHWLLTDFNGWRPVLENKLAVAFMLDCFLILILLAAYFRRNPLGPVRWPWFVLLSLLGGIGFALPAFYWMNRRRAA